MVNKKVVNKVLSVRQICSLLRAYISTMSRVLSQAGILVGCWYKFVLDIVHINKLKGWTVEMLKGFYVINYSTSHPFNFSTIFLSYSSSINNVLASWIASSNKSNSIPLTVKLANVLLQDLL